MAAGFPSAGGVHELDLAAARAQLLAADDHELGFAVGFAAAFADAALDVQPLHFRLLHRRGRSNSGLPHP